MEGYYQQPNTIDPSMVETLNSKAKMFEKKGRGDNPCTSLGLKRGFQSPARSDSKAPLMLDVQVEDARGSLSKPGNHDGDDIHTCKGQSGNPNNVNEGILSEVRVEDQLAAEYKENSDHEEASFFFFFDWKASYPVYEEASLATQNLNTDRLVLKQQGMQVNGEKSWGDIEDEEDT
ncbi:hypothetical protein FRX31_019195 [Thalictrum thalictroides]|uniref:Uncharacterized protein n=1 Tax=Thalictrum thalictroides TaxID=46969 RepID=A0A7J6W2P8_THATH|nr:hypothetical protein FRX31_019195 [Thalictrum thalictroides]